MCRHVVQLVNLWQGQLQDLRMFASLCRRSASHPDPCDPSLSSADAAYIPFCDMALQVLPSPPLLP